MPSTDSSSPTQNVPLSPQRPIRMRRAREGTAGRLWNPGRSTCPRTSTLRTSHFPDPHVRRYPAAGLLRTPARVRLHAHRADAPEPSTWSAHRTNDLDGDKRRRTLQGAETARLTTEESRCAVPSDEQRLGNRRGLPHVSIRDPRTGRWRLRPPSYPGPPILSPLHPAHCAGRLLVENGTGNGQTGLTPARPCRSAEHSSCRPQQIFASSASPRPPAWSASRGRRFKSCHPDRESAGQWPFVGCDSSRGRPRRLRASLWASLWFCRSVAVEGSGAVPSAAPGRPRRCGGRRERCARTRRR
jgi:hypothetical protein